MLVDGRPDESARVEPVPGNDGIAASGDGWLVRVQGLNADGQPKPLAPNESLVVDAKREVGATGTGFQPGTGVALYLNPPVGPAPATGTWWRDVTVRFTSTVSLGSIAVRADGTFDGMVTLPASVLAGDHALQAIGLSPASQTRAVVVGLVVQPWIILDKGKRTPAGRHDVIRARGDSGGLKPGDVLRPHLRFQGQKAFVPGVASIVIQSDGSFTWKRKIRPGKPLTAYAAWKITRSNPVHWRTVR